MRRHHTSSNDKNLLSETMKYLLDFYNSIWEEGIIQESQKKTNDKPMEITLRNQIVPYKESSQFLGMTLDGRLNWEEHINWVRVKAERSINTIKVVAGKKWGKTKKLKKTVQCNM